MNQHQAHAKAVQQYQVMDDVAEIRVFDPIAGQHDDEGAIAVGVDVGRSVTKPIDVFGHEPGPVINSSRKKTERNAQRATGRTLARERGWQAHESWGDAGTLENNTC